LEGVAERLRVIVGEDRLIARLGGDEFIVIQSPLGSEDDAAHLARRIVEALSVPFEVDGQTIITGASVGIAIAPRHGCDPDTLLKNADMALYRAKSEGRGTWRFFAHEMELRANERRSLELDLREALRKNAFELHYQPILNIKTRRIVGCEALLRWSHPDRGAIPPAKFIPLAEEIGLIVEMGAWVIKTACHEAARWPTAIRVAVNLSPMQFRQKGIVDAVKEALQESGLSPSRLELEITESVLLQDSVAVLQTLGEINQLGVRISLDDFGTGYSSLSYLRKFPLHTVKIDRSFLAGIEHDEKLQILMLGISNLCSALGLSVVVEGVETSAQLDQVMKFPGLQEVQGYLFAKPAPATFTRNLLKAFDQGSVRAINRRVRDRLQREK
jgi:predicted signal transduction protein with EAL and GGDEF domain